MRESDVESKYCKLVKALGGLAYKFISPNKRGVPDRLILYPIPVKYRELIAKYIKFVEFKAPGKKPRPEQIREHKRLQQIGLKVEVIDEV